MEHHLDSKISLSDDSKYQNLYKWFLSEVGNDVKKGARDQIPWTWTLYFTLTDITLSSTLSREKYYLRDEDGSEQVKANEVITAKLIPNDMRDHPFRDNTSYSMFGTERRISDFSLNIRMITDDGKEGCTAWGCVSYTSEVDFRNITQDDCILFYIWVTPERFAQYVERIREESITGATLRVGNVAGFYSDWSPAISTNKIKVLTADKKNHAVEIPAGCQIEPPRLGEVGEFELALRNDIKFHIPADNDAEKIEGDGRNQVGASTTSFIADPKTARLFKSIRIAAWVIAILLLVLVLKR